MNTNNVVGVLASKDRTRIKELYAQLFGTQADNKWATRDIAKRIKDQVASAPSSLIDETRTPEWAKQADAWAKGFADGELPFEAPRQARPPSAEPLPPIKSEHFTEQEIADIRARSAVDIDKMQREDTRKARQGAKRMHFPGSLGAMSEGLTRAPTAHPVKFIGAKKILAGLRVGTRLEHVYRDSKKPPCKVEVIAAPDVRGKGGVYSYKHKQYDSLREIAKLDSGQNFNILYFFGLAPWPKHKDRSKQKEPVK